MSQRRLNISEDRRQNTEHRRQKTEHRAWSKRPGKGFSLSSVIWLLTSVFWLLAVASCAPKYAEKPEHVGIPLDSALAEFRSISSIEAVLYVEYEKDDNVMGGDAFLNLSADRLNLRLYYLGFLAGEVSEEGGVVKSKPKLNRAKSTILVEGLKNSFLWWNIKDYAVQEKDNMYVLRNASRKLLISKDTLLPVEQTIQLDNGDELSIRYDAPVKQGPGDKEKDGERAVGKPASSAPASPSRWYQSQLSIKLKNNLVRVRVKSYSVTKAKG